MNAFNPIAKPTWTPWGTPDHAEQVMAGIWSLSTPRHGGFYVSAERRKASPFLQAWAAYSFNGQGRVGWFEEDCDWSLVALAFEDEWKAWRGDSAERELQGARQCFEHWIAKKKEGRNGG